jgi:hypothetical protein
MHRQAIRSFISGNFKYTETVFISKVPCSNFTPCRVAEERRTKIEEKGNFFHEVATRKSYRGVKEGTKEK